MLAIVVGGIVSIVKLEVNAVIKPLPAKSVTELIGITIL